MAKTNPIPCSSLILLLFIISSSCCVAEILLPLSHRLSHTSESSTQQHLLRSSSIRSSLRHRHQQQQQKQLHQNQRVDVEQVSVPLSAGSDYTLSLSVGPNSSIQLYMDTGSDLVWFPCSPFQCILCEGKSPKNYTTTTLPPPPQSKIVHCSDPSCSAAHSNLPSSDLCTISGCPLDALETSSCPPNSRCPSFYYAYGDGSLVGTLRRGHISLSGGLVSLPNFTFACAHSALAEPVGVAGFGRGLLSLPTQLSPTSLGSRFSYCLLSHSFRSERLLQTSPLILGRSSSSSLPFIYTPILSNPKHLYLYTVGLAAISIGTATIEADRNLMSVDEAGNGGLAVDSGTTFTMLPSKLYSKIVSVFAEQMKLAGFMERAKETESETGLPPCYYYSGRNDSRKVPPMKLHFVGKASLELPTRNYFLGFASSTTTSSGGGRGKRVGCLMFMDGGDGSDAGGGPAGTLGNFQQQGFEVVYDLEMDKVGFARRRCSLLWDQLTSPGRGG